MLPRPGVPRPDARPEACDGGSRYLGKTEADLFFSQESRGTSLRCKVCFGDQTVNTTPEA